MTSVRVLPLLALLAVAGCGGSSSDSASTQASTPAKAPKAKPASSGASAKTLAVTIKDFEYAPVKATVASGAKVTWTNRDDANHTVTFDAGAKKDLGSQSKGSKRTYTFAKAGTYAYHCDFHPNMHGTIVVR